MNKISTEDAAGLLDAVAAKICTFDSGAISERGRQTALFAIADTVAVALAGIPEDCTQIALNTPGIADAAGPSLIFGTKKRTSALDASFINGIASHALDYDDFSSVFGGHQSVPLVTPLLALAEDRGASGSDVFAAYLTGIETEMRFARAVHPHHYDKGWHPTATLGIFGTVASCARLIGLDKDKTALALAMATSLASGLKANFGTMSKPLHIGQSARNGLMAVLMAERGFTANTRALEHYQGFLAVYNGDDNTFDVTALLENWDGGPWENEADDLAIKQYPCCGSTHQCITAATRMLADAEIKPGSLTPGDIEGIEIMPHQRRLNHTNNPSPMTELQAKFSVQYVVARTLLEGTVKLKDFESDAWLQPEIRDLLSKTNAHAHPEFEGPDEDAWSAEIKVNLKDGRVLSHRVKNLIGRSGENAMSKDELWIKFEDCAQRSLPADAVVPAFEALLGLADADDVRSVVSKLEA